MQLAHLAHEAVVSEGELGEVELGVMIVRSADDDEDLGEELITQYVVLVNSLTEAITTKLCIY